MRAPPGYRVADARGVSAPARDLCASGDEDVAVTPFEHLSVLISIILGLGIAQLLTNVHALAQAADRVRVYWLSVLWATLIFVGQVEWWWSSFSFQKLPLETWSFFYFLFVLLSPVTLYLAAAFVLPGIGPGERVDLRAHYYRTKGWFFAMAAAGPALDAVRRGLSSGSLGDLGVTSNVAAAALVGSLALTEREAYHAVVTLGVVSLFAYFIVSAALNLG